MISKSGERCCHCIFLLLPVGNGLHRFYMCEISYFEADSNYTIVYFINRKDTTRINMGLGELEAYLEKHLTDCKFFRCHYSYIVHHIHVSHYENGTGGYMVMNDEKVVSVSSKYKNYALERLQGKKSASPTFPEATEKLQQLQQ